MSNDIERSMNDKQRDMLGLLDAVAVVLYAQERYSADERRQLRDEYRALCKADYAAYEAMQGKEGKEAETALNAKMAASKAVGTFEQEHPLIPKLETGAARAAKTRFL